jgi:hypothetical protein
MSERRDDPIRIFAAVCVIWLCVTALLVAALRTYDGMFFFTMVLGIFLIPIWAIVPVAAIVLAIRRTMVRQYRAALSWLSVPIAAVLLCYGAWSVAESARFWLDKTSYNRVLADALAGKCSDENRRTWDLAVDMIDCRQPIVIVFSWGGFAGAWHGVVYDASDEIENPPEMRSDTWKNRKIGMLLSCTGTIRQLAPHFYSVGGYETSGNHCH